MFEYGSYLNALNIGDFSGVAPATPKKVFYCTDRASLSVIVYFEWSLPVATHLVSLSGGGSGFIVVDRLRMYILKGPMTSLSSVSVNIIILRRRQKLCQKSRSFLKNNPCGVPTSYIRYYITFVQKFKNVIFFIIF